MPEHLGVVIIVLDETKKKLLIGKRKNAYKAGLYGLPGGRFDLKEPLADCVKRELKEETNLEAIEVTYLGVVREFQETYNFIHFVFLCENYNGKLETTEPDKCEGWEWFSLESIPDQTLRGHLAAIDIFKNSSNQLRELL